MSELAISQLIKIILGIFVFVAVALAIYFIFKERILMFFKNLPGDAPKLFLYLIK